MTESISLPKSTGRLATIDLLRGLVMVIMALDHVRDFFHVEVWHFDPTDMSQTTGPIFFTRWITHYCAPIFVLLSGVSARLGLRRKSKKELSQFLFTRGFWLILLEVTVVRFSYVGNLYYDFTLMQVIWVIGASMVVLAALVQFDWRWVLGLSVFVIFAHNALDAFPVDRQNPFFPLAMFLFQAGFYPFDAGHAIFVAYPLLPWLGIFLLGYGIGHWFEKGEAERIKWLYRCGIAALSLFVLLRYSNLYGDPSPWQTQRDGFHTFMSFLNVTKYPVSLLYTLLTVGTALVFLAVAERRKFTWQPLVVFGRVPLFYYLVHFYVIHIAAVITYLIVTGKTFAEMDFHFAFGKNFGGLPEGSGYSLGWVYFVWATLVIALYPLCKWYDRYKSTHDHWWLKFL